MARAKRHYIPGYIWHMSKKEGIANTIHKLRSKLDNPIPLGYSCAGIVREVRAGVGEFQVGGQSKGTEGRCLLVA